MNSTERTFVNFIGEFIFNKDLIKLTDCNTNSNIDWDNLLDLAIIHNVQGIIYYGLIENELINNISEARINELLELESTKNSHEEEFTELFLQILDDFKANNISTVIAKGLFETKLYRLPLSRLTNKVELLVEKKHINKLTQVLSSYKFSHRYTKDKNKIIFTNKNYCTIVVSSNFYKLNNNVSMVKKLQRDVWNSSIEKSFNDISYLTLNDEEKLLHLVMSMADDFKENKLYLMDICDFALLIDKLKDKINWDSFFIKTSISYIEKFLLALLLTCKEFFNIDIPKEFNTDLIANQKYIDSFIDIILNPSEEIANELTNKEIVSTTEKKSFIFKLPLFNVFKKSNTPVKPNKLLEWLDLQYN